MASTENGASPRLSFEIGIWFCSAYSIIDDSNTDELGGEYGGFLIGMSVAVGVADGASIGSKVGSGDVVINELDEFGYIDG